MIILCTKNVVYLTDSTTMVQLKEPGAENGKATALTRTIHKPRFIS